jgi:hypothetical protein
VRAMASAPHDQQHADHEQHDAITRHTVRARRGN